jgi:hypothetical protein
VGWKGEGVSWEANGGSVGEEEEDVLLRGEVNILLSEPTRCLTVLLGMMRALDDGSFFVLRESQQQG